jgi:hypothetical protein
VVVDTTLQTVTGLLGPVVRVTRYLAIDTCVAGSVQPMVMSVLSFAVAVGVVGADRAASSAWTKPELSVVAKNADPCSAPNATTPTMAPIAHESMRLRRGPMV